MKSLQTLTKEELLIWWLNHDDVLANCAPDLVKLIPRAIYKEVRSRQGRAGRYRLWTPSGYPSVGVDDWMGDKPSVVLMDRRGDGDHGGIVFRREFLPKISQLYGVITDFDLTLVGEPRTVEKEPTWADKSRLTEEQITVLADFIRDNPFLLMQYSHISDALQTICSHAQGCGANVRTPEEYRKYFPSVLRRYTREALALEEARKNLLFRLERWS